MDDEQRREKNVLEATQLLIKVREQLKRTNRHPETTDWHAEYIRLEERAARFLRFVGDMGRPGTGPLIDTYSPVQLAKILQTRELKEEVVTVERQRPKS